jgi:MFS family permease
MHAPVRSLVSGIRARIDRIVGGPARRRVITVFASVLALDSADKSTVGANATQLQAGLHIGKAEIGVLLAVAGLVGAVATLPAGVLVDRHRRTRLLTVAIAFWGAAMAVSGVATSFAFLLAARVGLGIVTAVSGPAVASLLGDYFPEQERGKIYGYVLSGELVGAGFGFLVAGQFAALSWRAPFFALVAPTVLVWWLVHRLPEPTRGGASRMPPDAPEVRSGAAIASGRCEPYDAPSRTTGAPGPNPAHRLARRRSVSPRSEAVLTADPAGMSLPDAIRYVVRVRTNVVLIIASALGYFFFSGVRGFAVEFAKEHYRVSQGAASSLTLTLGVGALGGVLSGGRLADLLLSRGRLVGRVEVPGWSVLLAAVVFVPALITTRLWLAVCLLILASLFLGASNPPLDAARLDIIHPLLWGRAEAVRTVLRSGADASAPILFGVLAGPVFGGTSGLQYTFLLMLVALFAAAVLTLTVARRTYPHDVAAAAASMQHS